MYKNFLFIKLYFLCLVYNLKYIIIYIYIRYNFFLNFYVNFNRLLKYKLI